MTPAFSHARCLADRWAYGKLYKSVCIVLKVVLLWFRRYGGPPRLAAGSLSAAWRKAGNKVGTLHAIPRRWAGSMGEAGPRGDCVALMRPADALAFPCGAWCGYRKHEKTGGRVSASCLFGFRVRLWVGWVLPYLYPPKGRACLFFEVFPVSRPGWPWQWRRTRYPVPRT